MIETLGAQRAHALNEEKRNGRFDFRRRAAVPDVNEALPERDLAQRLIEVAATRAIVEFALESVVFILRLENVERVHF